MSEHAFAFDLGGTIVKPSAPGQEKEPWPEAFRVIKRITSELDPNAWIISRVNEEQKKRAIAWLDKWDFFKQTGMKHDNVAWCKERAHKAPIADFIGVTHMIDDRPEVMAAMANSGAKRVKILIKPDPYDLYEWSWCLNHFTVVQDWLEIENFIFHKRQPKALIKYA